MKYYAVFYEFEPFHGKVLDCHRFWIPEYNLNTDMRAYNHRRTNKTETRELTLEMYKKLTPKQRENVIERKQENESSEN